MKGFKKVDINEVIDYRTKRGWKEKLDFALINELLGENSPLEPFEELLCFINCEDEKEATQCVLRNRYQNEVYVDMMNEHYRTKGRERFFAKKLKEGITNKGDEDYEISDNHYE